MIRRTLTLAFAVACIIIGAVLANGYIQRLPNHAGYFLVAVNDDVVRAPMPPSMRPRRTVFIIVDGLRRDYADTMKSARILESAGQCRISDQGSFTVSRPEYALLSTGLEVDRTGSRNNDQKTPLAAESIWHVARESGLRVSGSSHLPWIQQLFPNDFNRFSTAQSHSDNVFEAYGNDFFDVNVFHPLYVDENAHQHGAASPEYAAAVTRVDGEIAQLLTNIDLSRDLVILTADHGHRDAGGHGGAQPEIKNVLVCFAGPYVAHRTDRAAFDGRSTAPMLSVLLGLRFPQHMRAGDDGLDVLWDIARADASNGDYLADRRAAVDHFRDANRVALEHWLDGPPGTWPRLYEREARAQTIRAMIIAVAMMLIMAAMFRARRAPRREIITTVAWLVFAVAVVWCVHHLVLGDFDFTVINVRERFLRRAFAIGFVSAILTTTARVLIVERKQQPSDRTRGRVGDHVMLIALLLVANLGHIFVYGWPIGFPLPPQAARYFPFFGAIALSCYSFVTALLVGQAIRSR